MTTATRNKPRSSSHYYSVDADTTPTSTMYVESAAPPKRARYYTWDSPPKETTRVAALAIRWLYSDAVAELVEELESSGRKREAAAIRRVLGRDDDEEAMRAYVSRLWSDDWDSDEDSVYDE